MKNKILILLLLLLNIACSDENKTDTELLERDKKELEGSLSSYKVTPYKFGKILIRASVEKDTISTEFKAFKADLDKLSAKLMAYDLDSVENLSLLDYIAIYRDYKRMERFIMKTDEDIFPTLSDALNIAYGDSTSKQRAYYKGEEKVYMQNMEHAFLSALVILSKDLGKEVSLYECSKTKPELLPDSEIKSLLQYFRGFLFFEKGLYYLSEDEISRNIDWLNNNEAVDLELTKLLFQWGNLDDKQAYIGFHSLNHLFRGFDRLMMDREIDQERALADFEVFLEDSKKIGIDNEITWSIETYLYLVNEKNEKAIASLTKLKTSNLLSTKERKRIDESIEYLENREPGKVLNGFYDRYFLGKIATKYMLSILAQVDWKALMEENEVPHTTEMFAIIERFKELVIHLHQYASTEKLKETGKDLQKKGTEVGKDLWEKAKTLAE